MSNRTTKSADKRLVVLEENESEYICAYEYPYPSGLMSDAFMVPKVKPLVRPHRRYRAWEDNEPMCFVGSNNSEAEECDFWHERKSSIDELEREFFVGDAVAEWRDICRGI